MLTTTALQQFKSLNNNISLFTNDEASGAINAYINTLAKNTVKNYIIRVNDYLISITGLDINTITWNQLKQISYTDSATYQQYLISKGNSNKTINQKMGGIKAMFEFLATKYPQHNINPTNATVVKLSESEHDSKSHGSLSEEEVYNLFDFCKTMKYKPQSQQLFFETLFTTALRFDAVRTMTIKNIHHVINPETKQMIYIIKIRDKSKDRTIAIPDDLALRLLNENTNNDIIFKINNHDRIFEFGDQSLRFTLESFCKEYNIDNERNIKLHSLKKAAINHALLITNGNITEVAKFAGHSNSNTTLKYYTDMHINYDEQLSMRIGKNDNDIVKLQELSKEELLNLIEKAGIGTVKKLVHLLEHSK